MADNFGEGLLQGLEGAQALQMGKLMQAGQSLKNEEESIAIQQAKVTLQNQQTFAKKMAAMNQGGGQGGETIEDQATRMASTLYNLSGAAVSSGLVEQGAKYAEVASTIEKNQFEIKGKALEQASKEWTLIGNLAATVHDQQSWEDANTHFQMMTGKPSPFASQQYSPDLVNRIRSASQTQLQQVQLQLAQQREGLVSAETRASQKQAELDVARTQLAREQTEKLKRAGVTPPAPKASDILAITDLIKREHNSATNEDARVRARGIAEDAVKIYQDNPDKGKEWAYEIAYNAAKNEGKLAGLKTTRAPSGSSPKKPLPLPKASSGQVDPNAMQENQWYDIDGTPRVLLNGQLYTEKELNDEEGDPVGTEGETE